MSLRRRALLLSGALPAARAAPRPLLYARQGDPNADFCYRVLRDGLRRIKSEYELVPSRERVSHTRALTEMQRGSTEIAVIWTMTSVQREHDLLPVRFPLERGLFGWRVLWIRQGEAARFAQVRSLQDLRAFRFLQGHDWPDAQILAANGLHVEHATQFDALFPMLARQRADALPRGVPEVAGEWERHARPHGLVLEPGLVLRYPTALYCFVAPNRPDLARHIERALRTLHESGDYERMLRQWLAPSLQKVKLAQRRIIELHNPLLPPLTPLNDASLWFNGGFNAR
jgi:hypothetical protein